mmetsp:Transcript_27393/g.57682  ORF Transcript_27393/g.57682 Transcript_27393/m.57682 type:complete len:110 (+) Transcript_27393:505-834(+)
MNLQPMVPKISRGNDAHSFLLIPAISTPCGISASDQVREWKEGSEIIVLYDSHVPQSVEIDLEETRVMFLFGFGNPDVSMVVRERSFSMLDYERVKVGVGGGKRKKMMF